jgi:hypothetical protein
MLCTLQKRCTRLAAASDKAYQLLAHVRWFSPGTPASSTTKTGRHDIAEILLKVAINTKNQSFKMSLTIAVLVIGLYELLDNSLSHPDPERKTFRGIYMCNICSS